jgi:phage shock protein A
VDDAREQVAAVQAHMNRFQRELADVQRNADLSVQISDFDRFADFILDGLIFDWVVQAKIVDSLQRCKQTKTALQEVLSELESQQEGLKAQLQRLENQRTGLIEQG